MTNARNDQASISDQLTADSIGEVFMRLKTPRDSSALAQTSKQLNSIANDAAVNTLYWKDMVKIHFFYIYEKHQNDKNIGWQALFKEQYKEDYKNLTSFQKRLISAIKADDIKAVTQLRFTYDSLQISIPNDNGDHQTQLLIASRKRVGQYIYDQVISPHFKDMDKDANQHTLLYWSIKYNIDMQQITHLLKYHRYANINEVYNDRASTVHIAAIAGRIDVLDYLVSKNMPIDGTDTNGFTPLYYAVCESDTGTICYLIDAGANVNKLTNKSSALDLACRKNKTSALRLLLEKGANPYRVNRTGNNTALHIAAKHGYIECIKILLTHDVNLLNARSATNETALCLAIENTHNAVASYLIQQGSDLDVIIHSPNNPTDGKTAVTLAITKSNWPILNELLNTGASFQLAMDNVMENDDAATLYHLLKMQPARFISTYKDELVLRAARDSKLAVLTLLLNNKASASIVDAQGLQAIHLAAINDHIDCITKLLPHISINTTCVQPGQPNDGKTALFLAHDNNKNATVDWLLNNMTEQELFNELLIAIEKNHLNLATIILEKNAAITRLKDAQNKTALMIASELQYKELTDLLYTKNQFELPYPGVFKDAESTETFRLAAERLNYNLKDLTHEDIDCMIDTQKLLMQLNCMTLSLEDKGKALDAYYQKNHTITTLKYALYSAAAMAIMFALSLIFLGLFILVSGPFTLAVGPILLGITGGVLSGGIPIVVVTSVIATNKCSFFSEPLTQYSKENSARKLVETARKLISVPT